MTATVIKLRQPARLECSACGATADAACDCGSPYVPAGLRAAEAVAANPEKSDRAIAHEIGVSTPTVSRARKVGVTDVTPERRIGKDGKSYPASVVRPQVIEPAPRESTPNTRFLNIAWDAEHRPNEFNFLKLTNFSELADAAERVAQAWATAATELRRLAGS